MNTFTNSLEWRTAVKQYDETKKVSQQDLEIIEKAAKYAPSSMGYQPIKVIRVDDIALKQRIFESCQQHKVIEASALYVIAALTEPTEEALNNFLDSHSQARNMSEEEIQNSKNMIQGWIGGMGDNFAHWTAKQSYIALGFMLAAAAELRIDSTPMEGFNPDEITSIVKLAGTDYKVATMLTVGYRSEDDGYAKLPKVRQEIIEVL